MLKITLLFTTIKRYQFLVPMADRLTEVQDIIATTVTNLITMQREFRLQVLSKVLGPLCLYFMLPNKPEMD